MSDQVSAIREADRRQLGRVIGASSQVRVVTVRGEAGLGKTTLLAGLAESAAQAGWRVLRATGSTSESQLGLAGLHQLVRPLLGGAAELPAAQRSAFEAAFGLAETPRPADPLQLYLACLTLLSQQASRAPLLLIVDDAQWIDQSSLDVLAFIARRLADDPIALAFGTRETLAADLGPDSRVIDLRPLTTQEAGQLLDLQPAPPQGTIRAAVLDQSAGNPLALVELTRSAAGDPDAAASWSGRELPLTERLQRSFTASARLLPELTRRALLLAAAGDDIDLNLRYLSGPLGIPADSWEPARAAGLIEIAGGSVTFTHPLVRSALYQAATATDRIAAHRALAAALDHQPDRQTWQLAAAADGPDQALAGRLAALAETVLAEGRYEMAAAAWQRAAELTPDQQEAAEMLVEAAGVVTLAGQLDRVQTLAARALELTDDRSVRSRARQSQGVVLSRTFQHATTVTVMTELATETADDALLAWGAMIPAGSAAYFAGEERLYERVLATMRMLNGPLPPWETPAGSLPLVQLVTLWCATAVEPLTGRRAKLSLVQTLSEVLPVEVRVPLAAVALLAGDPGLAVTLRDLTRDVPALLSDGAALMVITWALLETGQWDDALEYAGRARTLASIHQESVVTASVTAAAAYIHACRGHASAAAEDAMTVIGQPGLTGHSGFVVRATHAMGMAALTDDRPEEAFGWLTRLVAEDGRLAHNREAPFGLIDLAEAAHRIDRRDEARELIEGAFAALPGDLSPRLVQDQALCRALLADGAAAEKHFASALAVTGADDVPFERARVELSYGQWLHRQRRDREARPHLSAAALVFRQLAATPWLETATAEQRASGVRSASPAPDALAGLSPSERQVVLLAAEGLTNPEIAARLFVSPRTVGSHLYRSFTKLGVANRSQLAAFVRRDVIA